MITYYTFLRQDTHWEELLQSVSNFISANTTDAHPGVSGVSRDQKFCEEFKNTHCQVDHPTNKSKTIYHFLMNFDAFLNVFFDFTQFWLDG